MDIVLLVDTFNSLSQGVYTALLDRGDRVRVVYAISPEQMLAEIEAESCDVILCPYLTRYVPESIYDRWPTFVYHPGPIGDRGAYALEHALSDPTQSWGGVWLRVDAVYDGGDIYAHATYPVRPARKASLYRIEATRAAVSTLETLFETIAQDTPRPQTLNPLHAPILPEAHRIDWAHDSTETILAKIARFDSQPGLPDRLLDVECLLFGGWREERMGRDASIPPKTVLAKRDGAICLKTVDGAVWISHLMEPGRFKLPATYVLKERLKGVREERLPLIFDRSYATFHEVYAEINEGVGYLHFEFHNGAMSTAQCVRLKYAFEHLASECDVVVLMGGEDFFSNGIHLNILEDSKKQGEDGWANINAMNDLVGAILYAEEVVTVASLHRNAGAGGVFLALACDHVVARETVVLNPHYRTLGLSGSEYHTWTLPRRIGQEHANALLEACLPISAHRAHRIGMVDHLFGTSDYTENLHRFARTLADDPGRDDFLWEKQEFLETHRPEIEARKEAELSVMHPEFWERTSAFHPLRRAFVYHTCPTHTPARLRHYTTPKEPHA
jgi:putative two-component system hydrogenase maturation factor HypX/HoxX